MKTYIEKIKQKIRTDPEEALRILEEFEVTIKLYAKWCMEWEDNPHYITRHYTYQEIINMPYKEKE